MSTKEPTSLGPATTGPTTTASKFSEPGATETGTQPPTPLRAPMVLVGRRTTMACLLSGAMLYLIACAFVWNFNGYQTEPASFMRAFELTPQLALPGPVIAVAGISLLTVGQVGLLALCSRRTPMVSRIAAVAMLVQLIGFAADMGGVVTLFAISLETAPNYPAGVLESLDGTSGALQWIGLIYLAGWLVGTVALAVALFRSRVAPWWVPSSLLLAVVADMAGLHFAAVDFQLLLLIFAVGAAVAVSRHAEKDWRSA